MKQKRGRKKGSGLLSGIEREEWSDIRNRIIYGSVEWRIVRLRQLILALKREQATAQRNMLVNEQLERLAYLDMLRKKTHTSANAGLAQSSHQATQGTA